MNQRVKKLKRENKKRKQDFLKTQQESFNTFLTDKNDKSK